MIQVFVPSIWGPNNKRAKDHCHQNIAHFSGVPPDVMDMHDCGTAKTEREVLFDGSPGGLSKHVYV